MPNLTAWPTSAELTAQLSARGLTLPVESLADGYIQQAVTAWENVCGYGFLGTGASGSILYSAPFSKFLHLGRWWRTITGVAIGVTLTDTTGTALEIGTNVFPQKHSAGRIYGLKFLDELAGSLDSVKITGETGWAVADGGDGAYLPDDAFQAVLDYACALAMDEARAMQGVVSEVKSADVTMKFAENAEAMRFSEAALKRLHTAAKRYRIVQF